MPNVASLGGNASTQTKAVAVRALATNQLTPSNTILTITRELRIAIANGFTLGVLIGLGVYIIYREPELSGVIAAAMVINNLIAGLSGILVPLTLDRSEEHTSELQSLMRISYAVFRLKKKK